MEMSSSRSWCVLDDLVCVLSGYRWTICLSYALRSFRKVVKLRLHLDGWRRCSIIPPLSSNISTFYVFFCIFSLVMFSLLLIVKYTITIAGIH